MASSLKKDCITIVVASDNHYAILIAALLKSLETNHKTEEHVDFFIIDDGISVKSKKLIQESVSPDKITLKWFYSKDIIPSDVSIPIDSSAFPLTAYLRIFAINIIDKETKKLIYLDVDTMVLDDISNLWNIQLGNYTIGAIQDTGETVDCPWAGIPNYQELGLDPKTKYFNSGVLLINAEKWREEDCTNKILNALIVHQKHVRLADQYGFNVVFANKWLALDPKWNWFSFRENDNPSIVHFFDIKPIFSNYNYQEVYKQEFFRYLSMTPWKTFRPISGKWRLLRKLNNKIRKAFMRI